jgi:GntR family transcriptional regulator
MDDVKPAQFFPGVPLYRQVQTGIEELIRHNPSSTELALSDAQLSERFGVSRITVRRAVDELVDAGVLYRIQGVGTFVRPKKFREKLTLNSFLDAWTQKAGKFDVRVAAFEKIQADKDVAERLNVKPGTELVYVQRLRFQKKALVAVDDRYIRADCCRRLIRQDVITSSLVDFLRNREKIPLARGEMDIEARAADRREARIFGVKLASPVLVRRVTFVTKDNKPVLTGVSTYRADRVSYRLTVSA